VFLVIFPTQNIKKQSDSNYGVALLFDVVNDLN